MNPVTVQRCAHLIHPEMIELAFADECASSAVANILTMLLEQLLSA